MFDTGERDIYEYTLPDGKVRKCDPLALARELDRRCGGDLNLTLERINSPAWEIAGPATEALARAVCATFRLGPVFDENTGEGVMYLDWCKAINDFVEWREKNARRAVNSPTSSRPGVAESSPGEDSATATTADCGGTWIDVPIAKAP